MSGAALEESYRACEEITRREAGNFYYGIRLLPPAKRQAMCAVYAYARRVDDIGDGELPDAEKLARLGAVREALARPGSDDPVMAALADAEARFALPRDALEGLVTGVEMDVRGETYESIDELVAYCRLVAGTIGRMCTAVFGASDPAAADPLADDLGVAMQLTNILRDVREDAARGRTYLPAGDLRRFGVEGFTANGGGGDVRGLVLFEAARAREWFGRGLRLLPLLDARSTACVSAMTGIYRRILDRIEAEPEVVLDRRVSLPAWEKTWVAVQSLARAAA